MAVLVFQQQVFCRISCLIHPQNHPVTQSTFGAHYLQRAHHAGCERPAVACMRLLCTTLRGAANHANGRSNALCTLLPPLLLPWLHILSRPAPPALVPSTTLRWVFELLARLLQLSRRGHVPLLAANPPSSGPPAPRALLTGQPLPLPQLQGAMQALWKPAAVAAAAAVADVAHVAGRAVHQLTLQLQEVWWGICNQQLLCGWCFVLYMLHT